jgi:hypothetical protein
VCRAAPAGLQCAPRKTQGSFSGSPA